MLEAGVTVLCSNYNSSRWIEGYCVALNQQLLGRFRIVFVDAASQDDSLERFRGFRFRRGIETDIVALDTRVGVYEAWNLATERSQTPYVINVNTDDRIFPAALLSLLAYGQRHPRADIVYGNNLVVADPDHKKVVGSNFWPRYSHQRLLRACLCGPFPLLKRRSVIAAGYFDPAYDISGDYEMWLRMSKQGYRFRKVPELIGSYYRNPKGISTDAARFQEHLRQDTRLRQIYA